MASGSESYARISSIWVVDAIGMLHEIKRRISSFLECLCPDCVIVVPIVICSSEGDIEQGTSRELSIEVESVPVEIQIQAICQLRTIRSAEYSSIVPCDFTISVEVFIFDVAHVRPCPIPCGLSISSSERNNPSAFHPLMEP